jgi:hypothetical protein
MKKKEKENEKNTQNHKPPKSYGTLRVASPL